jgi:formate hydrogenlyase subunit 3/multisubunit Na+/H+ antiporter MnhD subunit
MTFLASALGVFVAGGVAALLATPRPAWAVRFGVAAAVSGSALGLVPAFGVLCGREIPALDLPWSAPGGALALAIDPLSAFFLVPLLVVTAATAVYGGAYLSVESRHKLLGPAWLWFDLLAASLVLVATARNGLLFLVAWEAMALCSYFLVIFHHEREEVPRAGWVYLVATHLGTAFLLVLFGLLARDSGSLDFARWSAPRTGAFGLFALALVGFGAKAGLVPLHVWLPEAHPVAPPHVSALLSGVMVKMGVYGLLRLLVVLAPPSLAWGGCLLAVGLASAAFAALAVLAQRDLKRLLAYSTVENVGLVVAALGLAAVGLVLGATPTAVLALAGALLHVWNHALVKSLLFLAAGGVARASGTVELERLGGLLQRMPWSGAGFLVGAAALCALPPLNGFVGEFLVYSAAFRALSGSPAALPAALASIAGLGLVGALAAAGFVRAAGIGFLGRPRSTPAARAEEVPRAMRLPMLGLGGTCALLGLAGPLGLAAARRPLEQLLGPSVDVAAQLEPVVGALWRVGAVGSGVALGALGLAGLRRRLLRRRSVRLAETWGCGYATPSSRMQYTASSFAQPLTQLFAPVLRMRTEGELPAETFPGPTSFASHATDVAAGAFQRLFEATAALAGLLRPLQAGSTHAYILYPVLVALALLVWRFA